MDKETFIKLQYGRAEDRGDYPNWQQWLEANKEAVERAWQEHKDSQ